MLQSMLGKVNWWGSAGLLEIPNRNHGKMDAQWNVIKAGLVTDCIQVLAETFDFVLHVNDKRAAVCSKKMLMRYVPKTSMSMILPCLSHFLLNPFLSVTVSDLSAIMAPPRALKRSKTSASGQTLGAGDPGDVQTKSLNVDLLAEAKRAWDGLMGLLGFAFIGLWSCHVSSAWKLMQTRVHEMSCAAANLQITNDISWLT